MNSKLYFFDPNHGGCLRIMNKINDDTYIINGAYGSDEGKKGYWASTAKEGNYNYKGIKYNLKVDFSMKDKKIHGNTYYALFSKRKIKWQDGNTWIQMYG